LMFDWSIASAPAASNAVLSASHSATPSLTPDVPGQYVLRLVVNDGLVSSLPDDVILDVTYGPIALSQAEPAPIGLGRTMVLRITLPVAAEQGGAVVTVASDHPSIVGVLTPASITIPVGQKQGQVVLAGVAVGSATLTATASGFT